MAAFKVDRRGDDMERRSLLSGGPSASPGGSLKTSWVLGAINFMNGVVGAGILGLPYAIAQAGLGLGVFLCILVAVTSVYTVRLLYAVGAAYSVESYSELMQRAFGPAGWWISQAVNLLFAFGAMCSYLVIVADTAPPTLREITSWGTLATQRELVLAAVALLILFPLSLVRAYAHLAKLGVLKLVFITFLTVVVLLFKSQLSGRVASVRTDDWKYRQVHPDVLPAIGTIAFAFVCHHQTFMLRNSLRNPTPRRFALTTSAAIAGSFTVSLTMALAGYLTFFEQTAGDIFVNYEAGPLKSSPLLHAARLLLCANLVITYPSEMLVARLTVEQLLDRRRKYVKWLALQAPVHDVSALAALREEEEQEGARSADAWRCGSEPTQALWEHVVITSLLLLASLGIALGVQDLSKILALTGSFSAVLVAFVLPAAVRLRLGPDPTDTQPLLSWQNTGPWLVLGFGAVAFVASTGYSLVDAFADLGGSLTR